ncbi:MAG: hypothetical protein ACI93N_001101, partial [Flavobacteriaceae bacterium]
MIVRFLKKIKRYFFKEKFFLLSYSQEGEDILLNRIFNPQVNASGFYVDVGAHHPERFSNTFYF